MKTVDYRTLSEMIMELDAKLVSDDVFGEEYKKTLKLFKMYCKTIKSGNENTLFVVPMLYKVNGRFVIR